MSDLKKMSIELEPVDAMLIMSFLRIVKTSAIGFSGMTRAIDNFEYEICKNITPEQVCEANDALSIHRLLTEVGL